MKKWKTADKKLIKDCRIFKLFTQRNIHPETGDSHDFFVMDSNDWISVIPLIDDDNALLIRQYRPGIDLISLEFPGGVVDADENPLETAKRELLEETGYTAKIIEPLGWSHPNPAIQNNKCHFFVARNCQKTHNTNFDHAELIETETVPLKDIPKMITSKEISHSLMELAFMHFLMNQDFSK